MTINTRELPLPGGGKLIVHLGTDGDYYSEDGTRFPAWLWDKGYCGIKPLETDTWDPFWEACIPHDSAFKKAKYGFETSNNSDEKVLANFIKAISLIGLKGIYQTTLAIPYVVIGGFGGYFLSKYRKWF